MATGKVNLKVTANTTGYLRYLRRMKLALVGWAHAIAHRN